MAINDSKYQNQSSVTIEEIEAQDKPIAVGYQYTIKNVFDGLNKIIRAIVIKFRDTDSALDLLENRAKGVSSDSSTKINVGEYTYNFASRPFSSTAEWVSSSMEYEISTDKYLTHGYIKYGSNAPIEISSYLNQSPTIYSRVIQGTDTGNNSGTQYGTLSISVSIIHVDDHSTSLKVTTSVHSGYSNGQYYLNNRQFTHPSYTIEYELY